MNQEDILIIGLGDTGFSCAEYFSDKKTPVSIMDSRQNPPKLLEFKEKFPTTPVYLGGFAKEIIAKARTLIISPGISKDHPDIMSAVSARTEIIGDIELFAREVKVPVVGITGSNGKSTVTALLGEMAKNAGFRVSVGGNIGKPALSLLADNPECVILELSSFQLETTYSLKLRAATVLNISPDHMDRYASLEEYKAAKCRIYDHAEQWIINRDDPIYTENNGDRVHHDTATRIISFGLNKPLEDQYGLIEAEQIWLARGKERLLPISKLCLFGRHNMANALAALALGGSMGLPLEAMLTVLQNFRGLAHRCEWVREYQGIQWINDSKGTNVGATAAALQGLATDIAGKWVLIAGGVGKNADFLPLKPLIAQHVRSVILIGEAAKELENLYKELVPCIHAQDMEDAVAKAFQAAKSGDGVLLSPACASYDMFKNFEERGDTFKMAVQAL